MAEISVHYEGPIVTRAEAKAAGKTKYYDGKPCINGHLALRTTANTCCTVCSSERAKAKRLENPEAARVLDAAKNAVRKDYQFERLRKKEFPCRHCGKHIDFPEARPGAQRSSRPKYCSDECRLYSKVSKEPGQGPKGDCWEYQGAKHHFGYGMINRSGTKASDIVTAHVYSWGIENGKPVPEGMFVCHRCDNPSCVRPDHLFIGTAKDNNDDMDAKGRRRSVMGEEVNTAKLTDEIVIFIRQSSRSDDELAQRFSVMPMTIYNARNRITWKHLP